MELNMDVLLIPAIVVGVILVLGFGLLGEI